MQQLMGLKPCQSEQLLDNVLVHVGTVGQGRWRLIAAIGHTDGLIEGHYAFGFEGPLIFSKSVAGKRGETHAGHQPPDTLSDSPVMARAAWEAR
ncbi:hypothetical protein D3C86_1980170 [compost metagenome]